MPGCVASRMIWSCRTQRGHLAAIAGDSFRMWGPWYLSVCIWGNEIGSYTRVNLKQTEDLNVRPEIRKLEENIKEKRLTSVLAIVFWIGYQKHRKQKQN